MQVQEKKKTDLCYSVVERAHDKTSSVFPTVVLMRSFPQKGEWEVSKGCWKVGAGSDGGCRGIGSYCYGRGNEDGGGDNDGMVVAGEVVDVVVVEGGQQ